MSYHTKVVVFCGSADPADTTRLVEALGQYAQNHDRVADFERYVPDSARPVLTDGHGEVIIGSVNGLDTQAFLDALRDAARDPKWSSAYAPLAVTLRGDDDDKRPCLHVLDWDGNWS